MMEWSEMLPEVLDIIAQKYITCYEDYPSFACVCKSWRLAAARTYQNSNGPPSRLPSLMLAEKSEAQEYRELFLLSNKSIHKIRLPEAYGKGCLSSSCGWLLNVGNDFTSQLLNPLSREIINLPKVDTFPEAIDPLYWDIFITKVVLLMESKLVLVIWGSKSKLGFCHIGDNKWTSVEHPINKPIYDITFYNGQVYILYINKIQACDVNGKDPTVLVNVATIPKDVYNHDVYTHYTVGLDDGETKQLLVVLEESVSNDGKCTETKSFQILAYDLETGNWSKVKDLGTKTLFVGFSSSFWMEDTTGLIKGNCIYYTNDECGENCDSAKGGGRDMGIYRNHRTSVHWRITYLFYNTNMASIHVNCIYDVICHVCCEALSKLGC